MTSPAISFTTIVHVTVRGQSDLHTQFRDIAQQAAGYLVDQVRESWPPLLFSERPDAFPAEGFNRDSAMSWRWSEELAAMRPFLRILAFWLDSAATAPRLIISEGWAG